MLNNVINSYHIQHTGYINSYVGLHQQQSTDYICVAKSQKRRGLTTVEAKTVAKPPFFL